MVSLNMRFLTSCTEERQHMRRLGRAYLGIVQCRSRCPCTPGTLSLTSTYKASGEREDCKEKYRRMKRDPKEEEKVSTIKKKKKSRKKKRSRRYHLCDLRLVRFTVETCIFSLSALPSGVLGSINTRTDSGRASKLLAVAGMGIDDAARFPPTPTFPGSPGTGVIPGTVPGPGVNGIWGIPWTGCTRLKLGGGLLGSSLSSLLSWSGEI